MGSLIGKNTYLILRLKGRLVLVQQTTPANLWLSQSQVLSTRCENQSRRDCAQGALKILQSQHEKLEHPQVQVELVVHPQEEHHGCAPQDLQRNSGDLHSDAQYELIEETGNKLQGDRDQPNLPAGDGQKHSDSA